MGDKKYTVEKANRFIAENKHLVNTQYKPEEHFSAEIGWINDPNGFVYFRGEYHLFYQFYPYDSVWGLAFCFLRIILTQTLLTNVTKKIK
ncbi:sucrose-6-phosphate hydrolase [Streptococcus pneumoniae]|nr:sucrose-6-phosphate hydrolase [Streptococcus pneumoniae]